MEMGIESVIGLSVAREAGDLRICFFLGKQYRFADLIELSREP